MTVRGVVFDFDGVILDTETIEFEAWRDVFAGHGAHLALDDWVHCVGTTQAVDLYSVLVDRAAGAVASRDEVTERRRARRHELVRVAEVLPGARGWIDDAHARGLRLAIASNSDLAWPQMHLERLALRDRFLHLSCFDGVRPGKPDPYLYVAACEAIGVAPGDAIAIEDSPDGVRAATRAGLFTVAVARGLTAGLDLSAADVVVGSLEELSLDDAIRLAETRAS